MRQTARSVSAVHLSGLLLAFLVACQSSTAGPTQSPGQPVVSPSPAIPTATSSPIPSPPASPTLTANLTPFPRGPMLPPDAPNAVLYAAAYLPPLEYLSPVYQYLYVPISAEGEPLASPRLWWEKLSGGLPSGIYPSPDGRFVAVQLCGETSCDAIAWAPATGIGMSLDWSTIPARPNYIGFRGWAGDSSGLLYEVDLADSSRVVLATSKESKILFETDKWIFWATLAPDGRTLIYDLSQGEGTWQVDIPTQVTAPFPIDLDHATWSPDGQWVAFYSEDGLMLARPDGSDAELVSDRFFSGGVYFPVWSPGSDGLAFMVIMIPPSEYWESSDFALVAYVVDITAEGAGVPRPVVAGSMSGYIDPSWSPDGRYLLVVGGTPDNADIWLVSRDGTIVRQLTSDGGLKRYPVWIQSGAP